MKAFLGFTFLIISSLYAGPGYLLERSTAKELAMQSVVFKREVLLNNSLEGLTVWQDGVSIDFTLLPEYVFILDFFRAGEDYGVLDDVPSIQEVFAGIGVEVQYSETHLMLVSESSDVENMPDFQLPMALIVDVIALRETLKSHLEKEEIKIPNERPVLCESICYGQRGYCLLNSGWRFSNCYNFCASHPIPPAGCFDTCALERNFRDLECQIEFLICMTSCMVSC